MSIPICNVFDLFQVVGSSDYPGDFDRSWKSLEKAIYKGTACGAWIDKILSSDERVIGVRVGSIVEGADPCTEVHDRLFPFTDEQFWDSLQAVEDEAKEIWDDTHGCEHCWPDGYFGEWGEQEFGCWPINPDCPECNGEGVVL